MFRKKRYFLKKKFYIFKTLDFFYIRNIWQELCLLGVIVIITIGLLLILRFLSLGLKYNIWFFFDAKENTIFFMFFINIILAFVTFSLYLKYLNQILKDSYFKIHVYFLQYKFYTKMVAFLWNHYHDNISGMFLITTKIQLFFEYILRDTLDEHFFYLRSNKPLYIKNILFFRKLIKHNVFYKLIFKCIHTIAINQQPFEIMLFHYFPYIFMYLIFIIDLKNNEVKYFYYGLFLCTIVKFYREYRRFLGETDFREIDDKLRYYFYTEKVHASVRKTKKPLNTKEDYCNILLKDKTGIVNYIYNDSMMTRINNYFQRNYIIDYVDINFRKSYEPHSMRLFIFGIFLLYCIFCYNLSIFYCIIISIPLFCALILYEYVYKYHKKIKYIHIFKIIYILLLILACIIFVYIYLTRYNFHFITEDLWTWKIKVIQSFSVQEKIRFMKHYLGYKIKSSYLDKKTKDELLYLFDAISLKDYVENIPFEKLKEYIDDFILLYKRVENIYQFVEYKKYIYYIKEEKRKEEGYYYYIKIIFRRYIKSTKNVFKFYKR